MIFTTILSHILPGATNDVPSDFDLPAYKPDYFFVGDMVINDETGECATIHDIVPSPYPFDDSDYAYVVGHHAETGTTYSDFWTYEQMSLWISVETLGGQHD